MTVKELAIFTGKTEDEIKEHVKYTGDYYLSNLIEDEKMRYILDILYEKNEEIKNIKNNTEKQNDLLKNIVDILISTNNKIEENMKILSEKNKNIDNKSIGFVYLIKDCKSGYLKIGKTKYLTERLKSLKTGNPNITIIASKKSENYSKLEKHLHKVYRENNICGEWFKLSDYEISEIIQDYKFNLILN